jgi:serine/arginine repetitive matrix protein 2
MVPLMATMPGSPKMSMFSAMPVPTKPFASRRESPASSTGDSSSGRAPLTPGDGSDLGSGGTGSVVRGEGGKREEWGGGVSGLGLGPKGKHVKRRSVSFEDEIKGEMGAGGGKGKSKETAGEGEVRRRERRRSEAKAAIEVCLVLFNFGVGWLMLVDAAWECYQWTWAYC